MIKIKKNQVIIIAIAAIIIIAVVGYFLATKKGPKPPKNPVLFSIKNPKLPITLPVEKLLNKTGSRIRVIGKIPKEMISFSVNLMGVKINPNVFDARDEIPLNLEFRTYAHFKPVIQVNTKIRDWTIWKSLLDDMDFEKKGISLNPGAPFQIDIVFNFYNDYSIFINEKFYFAVSAKPNNKYELTYQFIKNVSIGVAYKINYIDDPSRQMIDSIEFLQ